VGVTVIIIVGDTLGVIDILGVILGVAVILGVILGVMLGVILGVELGVGLGATEDKYKLPLEINILIV
jgi:hypothetical protein